MSLLNRVERLEKVAGMRDAPLPNVVIIFEEPIQDADGRMRPGKCCGGIKMFPGTGDRRQWLDGDLNPVGPVMEYADFVPFPERHKSGGDGTTTNPKNEREECHA